MFKFSLFSALLTIVTNSIFAQSDYPYSDNGFYTLNGSHEPVKRIVVDKAGIHIGSNNYNWSNFNETYYSDSILLTDIVYLAKNNTLAAVGQVVNGKKSGLWIDCVTNPTSEHFNKISNVYLYKDGVLLKKKEKDLNYEDKNCYDQGFFNFNALSQSVGLLTDPEGIPSTSEEFDWFGKPLYSLDKTIFNGIGYVNESGACYVLLATYKNGYPNGLYINSNEGGYIFGFGEMHSGNKVGMWLENEYTGEAHTYTFYSEGVPSGYSMIFKDNQYVGRAEYDSKGELIECIGNCE